MREFSLPAGDARARGRAHGEAFRREIQELSDLRTQLTIEQGRFTSTDEVAQVADLHLAPLERFDVELAAELRGIAEGANVEPWRVVVLNHYTDLKDLDPAEVLGGARRERHLEKDEDCTAVVWNTPNDGMVLAQTWDMHGSAAPYVMMLHVPERRTQSGQLVPEAWLLSITGCLGMTGMNANGVGITINNLKSNDARVGLVWPALVRRTLYCETARQARSVVENAPLGSGHHYLLADRNEAFGIETSGSRHECWAELVGESLGKGFHHENHCVGSHVREVSSISPVSTTLERHARMETNMRDTKLSDAASVWSTLATHDGFPRSICTHLANENAPHAMRTCGGIRMELRERKLFAQAGCLVERPPEHFSWKTSRKA